MRFKPIERFLRFIGPSEGIVFVCETRQWFGDLSEVFHEPPVITSKSVKGSHRACIADRSSSGFCLEYLFAAVYLLLRRSDLETEWVT